MKSFYISLAIIIILLTGWLLVNDFLENTVSDINKNIYTLQRNLYDNNWNEVELSFNMIYKKWKKSLDILMLVIDHDEMEKVNYSLSRIREYINIREKSLLIGEIGSLNYLVNHVKQKESLSLDNIF